jgi:hypothetical protein
VLNVLRRAWTAPVVATLAFVVLRLAWALSTPPGAAPDEPSHYIRMVGLARGDLVGERVDPATPTPGALPTPEAIARMNSEAGRYELPRLLTPPEPCNAFRPELPFACAWSPVDTPSGSHISYHARYLPGAYVLPAAASRVGGTMWQTLFAGRVGFLLQATALFVVVAAAIRARCSVLGRLSTGSAVVLTMSVTPLVLFMAGTLAPNGTELLAMAACTASTMVLAVRWSSRWLWCAAICTVIASWSRDLGAPTVVLALVAVALVDPSLGGALGSHRREVRVPVLVAATGAVSAVVWQLLNKVSILRWPASWGEVATGLSEVGYVVPASVGLVGWLDTRVHPLVENGWVVTAALGAGAVLTRVAARVQRVVAGVAAVGLLVGVELAMGLRVAGFGLQARFLLPIVAIGVVILVMAPQRTAPWAPGVVRAVLVVASIGHLAMLLRAAHRHAQGIGQSVRFGEAVWSPPLGWATSITLMVVGSVLVAVVPLGGRQRAAVGEAASTS